MVSTTEAPETLLRRDYDPALIRLLIACLLNRKPEAAESFKWDRVEKNTLHLLFVEKFLLRVLTDNRSLKDSKKAVILMPTFIKKVFMFSDIETIADNDLLVWLLNIDVTGLPTTGDEGYSSEDLKWLTGLQTTSGSRQVEMLKEVIVNYRNACLAAGEAQADIGFKSTDAMSCLGSDRVS